MMKIYRRHDGKFPMYEGAVKRSPDVLFDEVFDKTSQTYNRDTHRLGNWSQPDKVFIDPVDPSRGYRYEASREVIERTDKEKQSIQDEYWEDLRGKRDRILSETDEVMLEDSPRGGNKKQYKKYRQALRELLQNTANPKDVAWPNLEDFSNA